MLLLELTLVLLLRDSHNTILDYDENTSFFAVYDGHGGHEVAHYCKKYLPSFIKETAAYKKGDIENALIDGFLGFDATLATPEVIHVLKELAGEKEADEDSTEDENMSHLYEEASQPIAEVLRKYTSLDESALKHLQNNEKFSESPTSTASSSTSNEPKSSSSGSSQTETESMPSQSQSTEGTSSQSESTLSTFPQSDVNGSAPLVKSKIVDAANSPTSKAKETDKVENSGDASAGSNKSIEVSNSAIPEIKVTSAENSETKEASSGENNIVNGTEDKNEKESAGANPEIVVSNADGENKEISAANGAVCGMPYPNKSKGKSPMKKSPQPEKLPIRPRRDVANQLYKKFCESEESEDTEDETFIGPDSSSDEEEAISPKCAEVSEDESTGADDEAEEGEEEEDDADMADDMKFVDNIKEEPGSDSGCTAVVAILKGCDLYVANAGDSRCIICRNGEAIEMSHDHKPEDWSERSRIEKAGGKVTSDGRVNGGLNLSRALGDHAYKQNKDLSDREQMITALPDVRKYTVNPAEDEFMVLACDGIWNYMTSQEVVDFVKANSDNKQKVSQICEEMFDHCLAPNTMGDGTGCDNMTAIIVKFQNTTKKRPLGPATPERADSSEAPNTKRQKTEDDKPRTETVA